MDKEIKVLVDEQSKQTMDRLKSSFETLLDPLTQISGLASLLEDLNGNVQHGNQSLAQKLSEVEENLSTVKKKCAEIAELQEDTLSKVSLIKNEIEEFKQAIKNIQWN